MVGWYGRRVPPNPNPLNEPIAFDEFPAPAEGCLSRQDFEGVRMNGRKKNSSLPVEEVSDTTLWRDRHTKMKTYAAGGIPEYWVLDVNARTLFVHRHPTANGYRDVTEYPTTQQVAPLAAPDRFLAVADLLA
ncbi:MAG: Uma2 family endonuclease [Capsulimonadales bacterium]|nr:Uma2 family endonuclease [Capsulimonadales bacterium]